MQERVTLTGPEPEEINDLIKDTSDTVQDFPKNSVQYLLWEEQGSILQDWLNSQAAECEGLARGIL